MLRSRRPHTTSPLVSGGRGPQVRVTLPSTAVTVQVAVSGATVLGCGATDRTPAFEATATLGGTLPDRVGRRRRLTFSAGSGSVTIPAAALAGFSPGDVVMGSVSPRVLMVQGSGGESFSPRIPVQALVPAAGDLVVRFSLDDLSWRPPAIGRVVTTGSVLELTLLVLGTGRFAFVTCLPRQPEPALSAATDVVEPSSPSITFTRAAPRDARVGQTWTPHATSSSGRAVTVTTTTPAVCRVVDGAVRMVGPGTCTVVATQAPDELTRAARAEQSFTVTRG